MLWRCTIIKSWRTAYIVVPLAVLIGGIALAYAMYGDFDNDEPAMRQVDDFVDPPPREEPEVFALDALDHDDRGPVLVDWYGMTLYVYDEDEPGESHCTGDCGELWPPLTVDEDEEPELTEHVDGEISTIEREDGTLQITLNDQPLYRYHDDHSPGDMKGHGMDDAWFGISAVTGEPMRK